jgi:hypothetical protein
MDFESIVWLPDSDILMYLFAFTYELDPLLDPSNIGSDIRYVFDSVAGREFLVIQFTKVRLASDTSIEQFDSHINYQVWFWEDGTIELQFGPYQLSESNVYVPGQGFVMQFIEPDTAIAFGPYVALTDPEDEANVIGVDMNEPSEYTVIDGIGTLLYMPAEGTVIRFSPATSVSTNDQEPHSIVNKRNHSQLISDFYKVPEVCIAEQFWVVDQMGKVVKSGLAKDRLDCRYLAQGIYYYLSETGLSIVLIKI